MFFFLEIIDDLANLVENTDDNLRRQTKNVLRVEKKSTSCGKILNFIPFGFYWLLRFVFWNLV